MPTNRNGVMVRRWLDIKRIVHCLLFVVGCWLLVVGCSYVSGLGFFIDPPSSSSQ